MKSAIEFRNPCSTFSVLVLVTYHKLFGYPVLCLFLLLFACGNEPADGPSLVGELPSDLRDFQKTVVGQLSGEYTLSDGSYLRSRWSAEERAIARDYLADLLQGMGITPHYQEYTAANLNPAIDLILGPFRGTNVYGILPASTNSNEYIILGAHYDSGKKGAPGAVDNATGIALIMSVAKHLKEVDRNINLLLVFFDQEEEELIGSQAFAGFIRENAWDVHSIHCFDMVGWDGDGDMAMEAFSPQEWLIGDYQQAAEELGIPLKDILVDATDFDQKSTDFDIFVPAGLPVIGAGECFYHGDYSPYKDTPDDTFATVDFDYLASCTRLTTQVIHLLISSE